MLCRYVSSVCVNDSVSVCVTCVSTCMHTLIYISVYMQVIYHFKYTYIWLCDAQKCSVISTIVQASVGSRCVVSQTSSDPCRVSRRSQYWKCFGPSRVLENVLLVSECRQASERQELACPCTQNAGVFSSLALAWNLGYQCSLRVEPATLRCRGCPRHAGEDREGRVGFVVSRQPWAVPLVVDRVWKAFVDRRGHEFGSVAVGYDDTWQSDDP